MLDGEHSLDTESQERERQEAERTRGAGQASHPTSLAIYEGHWGKPGLSHQPGTFSVPHKSPKDEADAH